MAIKPVVDDIYIFASIRSYAKLRYPPSEIIRWVREQHWPTLLVNIALLHPPLSKTGKPSEAAEEIRKEACESLRAGGAGYQRLADVLQRNDTHAWTTESSAHIMAGMAMVYGSDTPKDVDLVRLAICLLALNDWAFPWRQPNDRALTRAEWQLAQTTHARMFNRERDIATELCRSRILFSEFPRQSFKSEKDWKAFKDTAAGGDFDDYFDGFLSAIIFVMLGWSLDGGLQQSAKIGFRNMFERTRFGARRAKECLEKISTTRQEARAAISADLHPDGVPRVPTLFSRTPFVWLDEDGVGAVHPALVVELLRGGLWGLHRAAASNGTRWTQIFGQLFELYCRKLCSHTANLPGFSSQLMLSKGVGTDDEFEDVVFYSPSGDKVALISVKARALPEALVKGSASELGIVEWMEEFFFKDSDSVFKAGALRLLESRVARVRAGELEPSVSRSAAVHPIIVTYEDFGDDPAGYRWRRERLNALGLMQGENVAEPSVIGIQELELLMFLASEGRDIFEILKLKQTEEWRLRSFNHMIMTQTKGGRVPLLKDEFDKMRVRSEHLTELL